MLLVVFHGEFRHGETSKCLSNGQETECVCSKTFDNADFGFLKLTIDTCVSASCDVPSDTRTILSAGPSISVQMPHANGFFRFRVGLYNPDGTIVEDPAGHSFPAEAIVEWRAVLALDPDNANAKKNIDQAERLLKALEERKKK